MQVLVPRRQAGSVPRHQNQNPAPPAQQQGPPVLALEKPVRRHPPGPVAAGMPAAAQAHGLAGPAPRGAPGPAAHAAGRPTVRYWAAPAELPEEKAPGGHGPEGSPHPGQTAHQCPGTAPPRRPGHPSPLRRPAQATRAGRQTDPPGALRAQRLQQPVPGPAGRETGRCRVWQPVCRCGPAGPRRVPGRPSGRRRGRRFPPLGPMGLSG